MKFPGSMNRAACIDEVRQSQPGHYSGKSTRSVADGQSQHSFSNNSSRYFGNATLTSNLINTRPGVRFGSIFFKIVFIKDCNFYFPVILLRIRTN